MNRLKKLSCFIVLLSVVSCDLESNNVNESLQMIDDLGGIWEVCEGPDDSGNYNNVKYGFSNLRFAALYEYGFQDSECAGEYNFALSYGGTIAGGTDVEENDDSAKKINFKYTSVILATRSEDGASLFNSEAVCGYDAWESQTAVNALGANCELAGSRLYTPEEEEILYSIYRLSGENLYLGDRNSYTGDSDDQRLNSFTGPIALVQKNETGVK